MKPRTFTIAVVVLAVMGMALYLAGRDMNSRVEDALRRVEAANEARDPTVGLDEAASLQLRAELEEIDSALDRASLVRTIGLLAFLVAVIAGTHVTFAAFLKRAATNVSGIKNDR